MDDVTVLHQFVTDFVTLWSKSPEISHSSLGRNRRFDNQFVTFSQNESFVFLYPMCIYRGN
ncbi:MAG: hypothetical protein CMJ81_17720 [Planctomycetaceae bacterium]|nr:hypothetical protein [Planctomycetaceae bacterium]MBP62816.1 hypothetical protein [Planctomycetaceae bacterium]